MAAELDQIIDLAIDNLKFLFFPEEWMDIDLKFSKSELFAMLLVSRKEVTKMSELADYINVPMSTANGIAERLLKKGYIRRERSEEDRRIVVVELTEDGKQVVDSLKELAARYLKIATDALSKEEMDLLFGMVMKLVRNLKSQSSESTEPNEKPMRKIMIE